ncbi:MAG: hypothetical protein HW416_721 [Chloroflexi bacterium]|nr:hypothetical protein [Chloroflexota bacterium]
MVRSARWQSAAAILVLATAVSACASPAPSTPSGGARSQEASQQPQRTKTVTIGVTARVGSMGNMGDSTTVGGWTSTNEIHSAGLVSADIQTHAPVGRLAERVPTIENGGITLLPDGRMRVVYPVRKGVTWHDGMPFTAHDLAFSFPVNREGGLPNNTKDAVNLMDSAEASDDFTFVVTFKQPYYIGGTMGPRYFWPQPKHLLEPAYEKFLESKDADDFLNIPYWTSGYVHAGPFRLTEFDPGAGVTFRAYDGYFLGRPKLDVVRVQLFADGQTLVSNMLAGAVDTNMESTLSPDMGVAFEGNPAFTVYHVYVSHRFLAPQWRPSVQIEQANLDVRVRAALYHALDREALAEALQNGHREQAAWEILHPDDVLYPAVKDMFRPYAYDPEKAKAILRDVGWTPGSDGVFRNNADGRRFRNSISATDLTVRDMPAFTSYWRQIGMDVEEIATPAAQVRNPEYRASYPGWEVTSQSGSDGILGKIEGPASSAQTRWVGNRGGYEDARAQQLVNAYRGTLTERDKFQAMKAVGDFIGAELQFLPLFWTVDPIPVRKGVKAMDDVTGAEGGGRPFGSYTRNAHLWDLE